MCSVICEGRAAPERESMLMLCGGKEQGAGKDTRPGRGSLELGIDGVAPSLFFRPFVLQSANFPPPDGYLCGSWGREEGLLIVWLCFPFLLPLCSAASTAWGCAGVVGSNTFLASSSLQRELMSSRNSS